METTEKSKKRKKLKCWQQDKKLLWKKNRIFNNKLCHWKVIEFAFISMPFLIIGTKKELEINNWNTIQRQAQKREQYWIVFLSSLSNELFESGMKVLEKYSINSNNWIFLLQACVRLNNGSNLCYIELIIRVKGRFRFNNSILCH